MLSHKVFGQWGSRVIMLGRVTAGRCPHCRLLWPRPGSGRCCHHHHLTSARMRGCWWVCHSCLSLPFTCGSLTHASCNRGWCSCSGTDHVAGGRAPHEQAAQGHCLCLAGFSGKRGGAVVLTRHTVQLGCPEWCLVQLLAVEAWAVSITVAPTQTVGPVLSLLGGRPRHQICLLPLVLPLGERP